MVNGLDGVSWAPDGADRRGVTPRLELAIYHYGSGTVPAEQGHIRLVQPFTDQLDVVSEALFGLETGGRAEHPGEVLLRSVYDLKWREGPGVVKVVYVAGNEDFGQGPVDPAAAIDRARDRGIAVNTVYCGGAQQGIAHGWKAGAQRSGGRYLGIDANHVMIYVPAPQDDEIARLGQRLDETYVPYGLHGRAGLDNLHRQNDNARESGRGAQIERVLAKATALFRNHVWDLVDAMNTGHVAVHEVDRATLPPSLRQLEPSALVALVDARAQARTRIQDRLLALGRSREAWLALHAPDAAGPRLGLHNAIAGSLREQLVRAGFMLPQA